MARYFFHVQDGRDYHDLQGTELPDLKAARNEAVRRRFSSTMPRLSGHRANGSCASLGIVDKG